MVLLFFLALKTRKERRSFLKFENNEYCQKGDFCYFCNQVQQLPNNNAMSESELKEVSNEELLVKEKKARTYYLLNAGLIGTFIGVALYSAIKNG